MSENNNIPDGSEIPVPGAAKGFAAGFLMGTANVIPGVSGGTVAFIMGVFEPLIRTLKRATEPETLRLAFRGRFGRAAGRMEWKFLLSLLAGAALALVSASKLVIYLLEHHPGETFALFLGLMGAGVVAMWRQVGRWSAGAAAAFGIAGLAAFGIINLMPVSTPNNWMMSLAGGAVAIIAMILPGISGSFLLLILGQYAFLWGAVPRLPGSLFSGEASTLGFFALGGLAGLAAFVNVLNWLFRKHHDVTVAALIGFTVGSLPRLWPWNTDTVFSVRGADGAIARLTLPADAEALAAARAAGAKITALDFSYGLPGSFAEAGPPLLLIIAGAGIVALIEYLSGKKHGDKPEGK